MDGLARRALHGFAFGAGFSLAAALVWIVLGEWAGLAGVVPTPAPGNASGRTPGSAAAIARAPATSVRVANHRVERRHGDVVVLGTLHNDSDEIARTARVEAAFYDAGGTLVDLCGWYVAPALAPGEDKPFKIACGGTPDRPVPESASVRLRLVEAF